MGFEVNNPFLYQLREGSVADPFVDKVESLRVVDGRLLLSEMPVKQNGVLVDGHTEIDTNTPTGTQFYVDYTNGTVYFVSTKNATVTARYKGRGLVQIPSERIYHKKGSVTRTLDTIVETVDTSAIVASNAASLASAKATAADSAATAANTQSGYAKAQGDYAKAQGDYASTATSNANTATTTANNATNAASTATTQANAARDAANTAAASANAKATLAEQKAAAVDVVATKADTNANFATAQGTYAKEQGDYAKKQGLVAKDQADYAKLQGDRVDTRLSQTNTAEQNAITATTNAVAATQGVLNSIAQVTNQGTVAAQAAAQAASQADYAKAQGDYAKAQGDAAKAAVVGTITNKAVTSAKLDDDVQVGSLKTLKTDVKTSVTGALNEIFEDVTKGVMGGLLSSRSNINFGGKQNGNLILNPHEAKLWATIGELNTPSSSWAEFPDAYYSIISAKNSQFAETANFSNNGQVQQMFSFNLIEHVQRYYGITINGTKLEKVQWLRENISRFIFNWSGFGSNANGNKATVCAWRNDLNTWYARIYNSSSATEQISCVLGTKDDVHVAIDNNGFVHFLAYAEVSDGVTPSIINTDFVELIIDIKTDILSSLPVATKDKSGIFSVIDKNKLDNGQLFKLTKDDGSSISASLKDISTFRTPGSAGTYTTTETTFGLPPELESYERYGTLLVFARDEGSIQQLFINYEGRMFHRYLLSNTTYYPRYADTSGWIEFLHTGKVIDAILGNKIKDQSNANFSGKIAFSDLSNPHTLKVTAMSSTAFSSSLQFPSSTQFYDVSQAEYNKITSLGDTSLLVPSTMNNAISQQLFSFNLIEHIQRTYGAIPGISVNEKVLWLKKNLSKISFNWWGYGSSPGGNIARIVCFSGQWDGAPASHTSPTTNKLVAVIPSSALSYCLQQDGFIHFLAYADASDGVTASTITTDYVELNVELSTDLWNSAKPQWVNATLQNSWVEFGATQTPKYELGKDGFVELIGAVKSGTLGTTMMILPVGYRPIKQFTGLLSGSEGNIYRIEIDTSGIVTVTQSVGSGGNAFVSLDGVRFPVA